MTDSSIWSWIWVPVILGVCTFVGFARLHIWTWQRPRDIPLRDVPLHDVPLPEVPLPDVPLPDVPPTITVMHGPSMDPDGEEDPIDVRLWGTLHYRREALAAPVQNRQHNTVGEFPGGNILIASPGKTAWNLSTPGISGAVKRRPLPPLPVLPPGPSKGQALREESANNMRREWRAPSTPAGEWLSGDRSKGKGKGKERAVSSLEGDVQGGVE
ncbi:hypothetical protein L211DRAFT_850368 [Terfezia boudieri ATCC MYA-4762]|uniref:Uncharacterized protein n=1 Tax=Terfezia boudieri ATCC MYA-4762 TaxID=1051890 RepID=A0A3N4LQQ2_9PEZI|nr:hypothetical protein L211DRAFT_850368 [Terfezia boudieri ATCC MYA-4762]